MWGRASGGPTQHGWEIGAEAQLLLEPSEGGRYIYIQSEGAVGVGVHENEAPGVDPTPPSELLLLFGCGLPGSDAGSDPFGAPRGPRELLNLSRPSAVTATRVGMGNGAGRGARAFLCRSTASSVHPGQQNGAAARETQHCQQGMRTSAPAGEAGKVEIVLEEKAEGEGVVISSRGELRAPQRGGNTAAVWIQGCPHLLCSDPKHLRRPQSRGVHSGRTSQTPNPTPSRCAADLIPTCHIVVVPNPPGVGGSTLTVSDLSIKDTIPRVRPLPLLAQFSAVFSHPTEPHNTPCSCKPHSPLRSSVSVGSVSLPRTHCP